MGRMASEAILALYPGDAENWTLHGVALSLAGREKDALAAYDRALELDPGLGWAWANRGATLMAMGQYQEALTALDTALELEPDDVSALANRASALSAMGRHEEAIVNIDQALEITGTEAYTPLLLRRAEEVWLAGREEEGSVALDEALGRFVEAGEPDRGAVGDMVRRLLAGKEDEGAWAPTIRLWLGRFTERGLLPVLAAGLVRSIETLVGREMQMPRARAWRDVWHELGTGVAELEVALRLLDAAVRWRETEDPRVLLGLAAEERKLLNPLLGLEPDE